MTTVEEHKQRVVEALSSFDEKQRGKRVKPAGTDRRRSRRRQGDRQGEARKASYARVYCEKCGRKGLRDYGDGLYFCEKRMETGSLKRDYPNVWTARYGQGELI